MLRVSPSSHHTRHNARRPIPDSLHDSAPNSRQPSRFLGIPRTEFSRRIPDSLQAIADPVIGNTGDVYFLATTHFSRRLDFCLPEARASRACRFHESGTHFLRIGDVRQREVLAAEDQLGEIPASARVARVSIAVSKVPPKYRNHRTHFLRNPSQWTYVSVMGPAK